MSSCLNDKNVLHRRDITTEKLFVQAQLIVENGFYFRKKRSVLVMGH